MRKSGWQDETTRYLAMKLIAGESVEKSIPVEVELVTK